MATSGTNQNVLTTLMFAWLCLWFPPPMPNLCLHSCVGSIPQWRRLILQASFNTQNMYEMSVITCSDRLYTTFVRMIQDDTSSLALRAYQRVLVASQRHHDGITTAGLYYMHTCAYNRLYIYIYTRVRLYARVRIHMFWEKSRGRSKQNNSIF